MRLFRGIECDGSHAAVGASCGPCACGSPGCLICRRTHSLVRARGASSPSSNGDRRLPPARGRPTRFSGTAGRQCRSVWAARGSCCGCPLPRPTAPSRCSGCRACGHRGVLRAVQGASVTGVSWARCVDRRSGWCVAGTGPAGCVSNGGYATRRRHRCDRPRGPGLAGGEGATGARDELMNGLVAGAHDDIALLALRLPQSDEGVSP